MGTTANRAYPYPALGDAADVPARIQALAEALDVDVEALADALAGLALDGLSDVDLTGAVDGDLLVRAGGLWTPGNATSAEDLTTAETDTAKVLNPDGAGGVAWGAAAGGGDLTVIAESVLGSDAASVVFSSIPATYRHLMLVWSARSTAAVTSTTLALRFNGDTTAVYDHIYMQANNTTVNATPTLSTTLIHVGLITAATASPSRTAGGRIDIPNYASTTFHKNVIAVNGAILQNALADFYLRQHSGIWRPASIAAVNSVTLLPLSGNLLAGSTFTLYGLAAA